MGQRIWQRLSQTLGGIGLGWSKALWGRFALATLLVFVVAPAFAHWLGLKVDNALLWVTGVILLVYTIETQEMRRQMVLQNEIAIQPVVTAGIGRLELSEPPARRITTTSVILRNIGRGPALFIQVQDIPVADAGGVRFVSKFATVDYIEAGKDVPVAVRVHTEAEGEDRPRFNFVANLDPDHANQTYDVIIRYEDLNGQRRESEVRMGKGGIKLLRHGKV